MSARPNPDRPLRLGVLVPCRNEAAVVRRKLANLAALEWPAGAEHRALLVDDNSTDDTTPLAERCIAELRIPANARFGVTANAVRPGKPGALEQGIRELAPGVDVIALTDADVVLEPRALVELENAFRAEPRLGMASGSQRFVRDLAADGRARGADGAEPVDAGGLFDRWTACVRALESKRGMLFSVHGQLLGWRTDLRLEPPAGVAADDLELMLQCRARGYRVELLPRARFLEIKTSGRAASGGESDWERQAVRRARAYVQVVLRHEAPLSGLGGHVQWLFYRHAPLSAPWLALACAVLVPLLAWLAVGPLAALAVAALLALAALTPVGRRLVRLLRVIARATRLERRESMGDRWEMARP